MALSAKMDTSPTTHRLLQWLAISSGALGICSFASLIVYITSPNIQMRASGAVAPMGEKLLAAQFLCSAAQFLMMVPIAIWFYRSGCSNISQADRIRTVRYWTILGVLALAAVGLLRLVAMVDAAISDILFMLPLGLVGVWLMAINWVNPTGLPGWMRVWSIIAGICLAGVGLNFLFNGGLAVFSEGPMAYGSNVNFHIGLGLFGFPGFILFATWSILLGVRLSRQSPKQLI